MGSFLISLSSGPWLRGLIFPCSSVIVVQLPAEIPAPGLARVGTAMTFQFLLCHTVENGHIQGAVFKSLERKGMIVQWLDISGEIKEVTVISRLELIQDNSFVVPKVPETL